MCPDDSDQRQDPSDSSNDPDGMEDGEKQFTQDDESVENPDTDLKFPFSVWDSPKRTTSESVSGAPGENDELSMSIPFKESSVRQDSSSDLYESSKRSEDVRDFLIETANYLDDIQDNIDELQTRLDDPPAYITQLDDHVDELEVRCEDIRSQFDGTTNGVEDVDAPLQELRKSLKNLQNHLTSPHRPQNIRSKGQFEEIVDSVNRIRGRLDALAVLPSDSEDEPESRVLTQDISRRAAIATLSTVVASVVTLLVFDDDGVATSSIVFGYGGNVVTVRTLIPVSRPSLQQGYGDYGYGGVQNDEN